GDDFGEGVGGVGDGSAKDAAVEVLAGAAEGHFAGDDAPQAVGDGGNTGGVLGGVADHDDVAGETLAIGVEKPVEVVAADFFFAFDDEFDVDRQPAVGLEPSLDRFDVRIHLPFVVGRAAGVDVAV